MPSFFRRFFLGDFGPPPPPDVTQRPSICGQNIIETLYSDSKERRAVITLDQSGIYRIHFQFWDTSDWKNGYRAFWCGGNSGSITDSLEILRDLAREQLGAPS